MAGNETYLGAPNNSLGMPEILLGALFRIKLDSSSETL